MIKKHIHKKLLIGIILILFSFSTFAQKTVITIKQADNLRGFQENGIAMNDLTGNVILIHDSTTFYCDYAKLDKTNNMFRATGNIRAIMKDSVELFGKRIVYNGETKILEVFEDVELVDDTMTLTTDYLIYNKLTKVGIYTTGGKIIDGEMELISKIGRLYTEIDEYYFEDSVVVTKEDFVIETDTLTYNSKTEIVTFNGPTTMTGENKFMFAHSGWSDTKNEITSLKHKALVRQKTKILRGDSIYYNDKEDLGQVFTDGYMIDTEKEVVIKGDYLDYKYSNPEYAYAIDSTLAILYNEEDSLYLHADTLKIKFDEEDEAEYLYAYKQARFFKNDMQGACDSLVYAMSDSTIKMMEDPIVWSDENQLTSESMLIFISNNKPDSLSLSGGAFIVSEDTLQCFNQISGREVMGYFIKKELRKINVNGNSETIYFVRDDETTDLLGINKAVASNMIIRLADKNLKSITYIGDPEATLFPEKEVSRSERELKGFSWRIDERPKSKDDIYPIEKVKRPQQQSKEEESTEERSEEEITQSEEK